MGEKIEDREAEEKNGSKENNGKGEGRKIKASIYRKVKEKR